MLKLNDLGYTGIVIAIAGVVCLCAIAISKAVDLFYQNKLKSAGVYKNGSYECGFNNTQKICFCDTKQRIVSYFLIFELMIMWIITYAALVISSSHSQQQKGGIYFLLITMIICIIYSQKIKLEDVNQII